jgi:D-alanine-D-alanine ligase
MKVTILTYLEREDDERSYDVVVDQVAEALRSRGHTVTILGAHGDVRKLLGGLSRKRLDVVFNLMEMFRGNVCGDVAIAGLLDLLGIPHTGGGPGEYYLQQDKSLTKKLLAFDGIRYPKFAVFPKDGDREAGSRLHMPLFVKPLRGDASIGIDSKSLVKDKRELMQRVALLHERLNDSALAEEYVDGREFYVGVLGNDKPQALPAIEMDFSGLPPGTPRILDRSAKFAVGSERFIGTRAVLASIPDDLQTRLAEISLAAYKALRVRDYGRVDLRLTESGDIFVIEVNASCYLERNSEFAVAAAAAGIEFPTLLERIAELARERHARTGILTADSSPDERDSLPTP